MKYTITLTAEDLEFLEEYHAEQISGIVHCLKERLEGNIVEVPKSLNDVFSKLEVLIKPLKQQSEGTPLVTGQVCNLLNRLLGLEGRKGYKASTLSTKKLISARIAEGYVLEDFLEVIDKKVTEWKDTEQEKYLRPETLFGNKFAGYLAQKADFTGTPSTEQQRQTDYSEDLP